MGPAPALGVGAWLNSSGDVAFANGVDTGLAYMPSWVSEPAMVVRLVETRDGNEREGFVSMDDSARSGERSEVCPASDTHA